MHTKWARPCSAVSWGGGDYGGWWRRETARRRGEMARGQVELGASAARRGSRRHGPVPRGLGPRRASGRRAGQSDTRRLGSWLRGHGGRRRRVRGQVAARAARRRSSSTGSSSSTCERRSRVREREAVVELQQKRIEEGESTRGLSTANAWR